MKFRINTYNEDYIMIEVEDIFLEHLNELRKKDSKIHTFISIHTSIVSYECQKKESYTYPEIQEIAINKNSNIGTFILAKQNKPENITIELIIHSLLICIYRNDWKYYDTLSNLIKIYGQQPINEDKMNNSVAYDELMLNIGEEITNYIVNSKLYSTKILDSDKIVYSFEDRKIIKKELEKHTKVKKRTFN